MRRYLPYWCCYLHQGMLTALILQGVVGYFRHSGLDLAQLSWLSLSWLPWIGKFLWAPWCEGHALGLRGNRYLGSLVILQLGMALLMAGIGLLSPSHAVGLIVPALMLLALLSASHDIYADGMIICTTDPRSRPFANAAQVGGSYLGVLFGSFAFLALAQHAGWTIGFLGMATSSLLLLLPLALQPRMSCSTLARARPRLDLRDALELWPALALTATYYVAMRGLLALQTVILVDRGLDMIALGETLTAYTLASGLGVLLGSILARRLGAMRSLLPVMALHALLSTVLAAGYPLYELSAWVALLGVVNLAAAAGFVTLYNLLMGLVRPHRPASDYALFQSIDAAVAMITSLAALRFAHFAGYRPVLAVLAAVAIASLPLARWLCARLAENTGSPSVAAVAAGPP